MPPYTTGLPLFLFCLCLAACGGHTHDPAQDPDGGNLDPSDAGKQPDAHPQPDARPTARPDAGIDGGMDVPDAGCMDCPPVVDLEGTCSLPTYHDALVGAGRSMMASQGKAYLFVTNTMWSIYDGSSALTQNIPLPPGVDEMRVLRASVEPDGHPLVLFTAEGLHYTTRFVNEQFTAAVLMPLATRTVHADGSGTLYAVDGDRVLWQEEDAEFLNRGALPVSTAPSDTFAWAVDWFGVVHLVHTSDFVDGDNLYHTRLGSLAWSASTDLLPNVEVSIHQPYLAAASDGSLHLAYGRTSFGPTQLLYRRSADGLTFDEPELLGSDHRLSVFEARSWANVSALHDAWSGSYDVVFSTRCGGEGWTHRVDPFSYARNPHSIGAVDENGVPAFLIATGLEDAVVVGM